MKHEIMLERETANDEIATIVAVLVSDGGSVAINQLLFEVENSKATQEVVAPVAGVLRHELAVGSTVEFGVTIATVDGASDDKPAEDPLADLPDPPALAVPKHVEPEPVLVPIDAVAAALSQPAKGITPTIEETPAKGEATIVAEKYVSHAAAEQMAIHGLSPALFANDFITVDDVHALTGKSDRPSVRPIAPPKTLAIQMEKVRPGVATHQGSPVGGKKRAEIEALSQGAGNTMLSVLGVALGAMKVSRAPTDYLQDRITDLVIYEASRLMRKYPRLNAAYLAGNVLEHDSVHAGLAIDGGRNLVVYGIENTDRLTFSGVANAIKDAVDRYAGNSLTKAELTRATFSVTDLSGDDLDFVLPLLPVGQSCVLGVTRSKDAGYRIFAGFDHRVTEGLEVASFLGELKARLTSFESEQTEASALGPTDEARCSFCDQSVASVVSSHQDKGLLRVVDRTGKDALCCASCWNGW